jgi:selenide,water dikinase
MLLFDAQTSGGLLLSIPAENVDSMLEKAAQLGQDLWVIGEVVEGEGIEVV